MAVQPPKRRAVMRNMGTKRQTKSLPWCNVMIVRKVMKLWNKKNETKRTTHSALSFYGIMAADFASGAARGLDLVPIGLG